MAGNEAIVRTLYECFNDRDLDRGAAVIADDARLIDIPTGETFTGPDGFRASMQRWLDGFPDGKVEIKNLISAGDWVVVEAVGTGTNTGPLAGPAGEIPATGRSLTMPICDVIQLRNGKVVLDNFYFDNMTMMAQLGLMPDSSGATA